MAIFGKTSLLDIFQVLRKSRPSYCRHFFSWKDFDVLKRFLISFRNFETRRNFYERILSRIFWRIAKNHCFWHLFLSIFEYTCASNKFRYSIIVTCFQIQKLSQKWNFEILGPVEISTGIFWIEYSGESPKIAHLDNFLKVSLKALV